MNIKQKLLILFGCLTLFSIQLVRANNPFLKGGVTSLSASISKDNSRAVMIVLDVSGSMAEPSPEGGTKILMAKQVLERVLARIDSSVPVGLRVYGSSKPSYDPSIACQDSILLVTPGVGNRGQMISKLRELKPSGATPISFAMRQAVYDLRFIDVKNKNIVLISDGMETCGGDPCDLAKSLKTSNIDLQFNVVGFDVGSDFMTKAQLNCIAQATKGKYLEASTAGELSEGILEGVNYRAPTINTVSGKIQEVRENKKENKK